MIFESEGKTPIVNPTVKQVKSVISKLRSYGPSSFASITDENGSYLQVAGGGVTCMLEKYDSKSGRRFRAYGLNKNLAFPDGTLLVFRGGELKMKSDEWFRFEKIIDAFCCFLEKKPLPIDIFWRPAPGF